MRTITMFLLFGLVIIGCSSPPMNDHRAGARIVTTDSEPVVVSVSVGGVT